MNTKPDKAVLPDGVLMNLISTTHSTTLYLENVKRKKLKVDIVRQHEEGGIITRVSRLYFSAPQEPVLYCISHIRRRLLTPSEYLLIAGQKLPLGTVFAQLNHPSVIFKKNIHSQPGIFEHETAIMNLQPGILYRKKYDFLIGTRSLATIEEFFNAESLQRS